jgi:hypothetical protein
MVTTHYWRTVTTMLRLATARYFTKLALLWCIVTKRAVPDFSSSGVADIRENLKTPANHLRTSWEPPEQHLVNFMSKLGIGIGIGMSLASAFGWSNQGAQGQGRARRN